MADRAFAAGRRFAATTAHRRRAPGRAARQHALRYPDMFTEGGEVHPIRNSPGYDTLEDRAGGLRRARRDELERQREDYERGEAFGDARRSYEELIHAVQAQGGIRVDRDYSADEIPPEARGRKRADLVAAEIIEEGRQFRYDSAEELVQDIQRRRRNLLRHGIHIDKKGRARATTQGTRL